MKTLYLECAMGAAGDMLAAALADLTGEPSLFISKLNDMNIPGVSVSLSPLSRCGIEGKKFSVLVNGVSEDDEHHHGHCLKDIEEIVSSLNTSEDVKNDIIGVYNIIAEAEGKVHGRPVREVHFHEVGMMDAIADIAAVCLAMKMISPQKIIASPIHVGSGQIKCAHGILPVPAPATAEILRGIPIYGGKVRGELCTPTGAALLKYFVTEFGEMDGISVNDIGYGMGNKEFEAVNCVRAFLGDMKDDESAVELRSNIDDMTAEDMAYATECILRAGALDVWTESIGMKKSRPGIMLCVLCNKKDAEEISRCIFKHTTTLGIREIKCQRRTLARKISDIETKFGTVRKKVAEGYGVVREKYEYEDVAEIARKNDMSTDEVKRIVKDMER